MTAKQIDWQKAFEVIDHLVWLKNDVPFKAPEARGPCDNDLILSTMRLADVVGYGPTKEERDLMIAALSHLDVRDILWRCGYKLEDADSLLKKLGAR
jgi:hypothetical protein